MRKIYTRIVGHPKLIFTLFMVLAALGIFFRSFVAVNYDIIDYLPAASSSTISIDVMNEEFSGGIPNIRAMVKGVSIAEALEYKERLKECEGVESVLWLDDSVSIYEPLELADPATVETYYKDGNALFTVTVVSDDGLIAAVDNVRAVIGDNNAMTGDAVSTAIATTGTENEIILVSIFAVIFVLFILLITTTSWLEPLVILLGLGVAILINMGSNIIFGEISFVTNAAGAILQLAVSLDYSVFLLHRYEECLAENPSDSRGAMVDALCKSTTSIASSGLTTVIGFVALIFMRFRLGSDLGLALSKGVAISLVTVFTFMPVFILMVYPLLQKTRHRKFMPSFRGFGKFVSRAMFPLALIFIILIVPFFLSSNKTSYYYGGSYIYGIDTQYGQDTAEIEDTFGKSDTYVLMVPNGDIETEQDLSAALHEVPEVTGLLSYVDTVGAAVPKDYLDADTLALLVSDNYTRFVITVNADSEGDATFALVERIREIAEEFYPGDWYLAGKSVSIYDLMDTITSDMLKINLIAIAAVFVILLLTMKSLLLPFILVFAIEAAIFINTGTPYFMGTTVMYIAYLIISTIQLGATVDYAILFTDRYLEHRQSMGKKDAVISTVSSVTVSILTSGTAMAVVGFLMYRVSSHAILSQLGLFLCRGTLLSMVSVFFVLPGLLFLLDKPIQKTTLHLKLYSGDLSSHSLPCQGEVPPKAAEGFCLPCQGEVPATRAEGLRTSKNSPERKCLK